MSTQETQPTPRHSAPTGEARRIPAPLLWFAVLGGVTAWSIQLIVTWSAMELACITPIGEDLVDQRGGNPGTLTWGIVIGAMAVPWIVAVLAFLSCLWIRRRLSSYSDEEEPTPDVLSRSRTAFLVVLGLFLDAMAIAIISGSIIGLWLVDPCT